MNIVYALCVYVRFLYVPPPVSAEGGGKQAWFPMMLGLEVLPTSFYTTTVYRILLHIIY